MTAVNRTYITIYEAAARTGKSVRTIRRWIADDKVLSVRLGPRCRMVWANSLPDATQGNDGH
jgi:excisionase family DNA binding protein